jgi:hypothetical protein
VFLLTAVTIIKTTIRLCMRSSMKVSLALFKTENNTDILSMNLFHCYCNACEISSLNCEDSIISILTLLILNTTNGIHSVVSGVSMVTLVHRESN